MTQFRAGLSQKEGACLAHLVLNNFTYYYYYYYNSNTIITTLTYVTTN